MLVQLVSVLFRKMFHVENEDRKLERKYYSPLARKCNSFPAVFILLLEPQKTMFFQINALLAPHVSTMCLRISHVIGGSICIAMHPGHGGVVHLEPIDLKRLQAKSIFEYLSDIAENAKVGSRQRVFLFVVYSR